MAGRSKQNTIWSNADRDEPDALDDAFTVMTFNTGNDLISPDALTHVIETSNASIIALQELSPRNAEAIENHSFERPMNRVVRGEYINGKGLLTTFPMDGHEIFTLASGRPYIEARIKIDGRDVALFIAHPPPPSNLRKIVWSRQDLLQLIARMDEDTPTLLMGDFNFTHLGARHRRLRQNGFTDTFFAVGQGRGLTYPIRYQYAPIKLPLIFRLDYIWASEHFTPVESYVGEDFGSDHLPLFTDLVLNHSRLESGTLTARTDTMVVEDENTA